MKEKQIVREYPEPNWDYQQIMSTIDYVTDLDKQGVDTTLLKEEVNKTIHMFKFKRVNLDDM
jgi:hypothetical protein